MLDGADVPVGGVVDSCNWTDESGGKTLVEARSESLLSSVRRVELKLR